MKGPPGLGKREQSLPLPGTVAKRFSSLASAPIDLAPKEDRSLARAQDRLARRARTCPIVAGAVHNFVYRHRFRL